MILIYTTLPDLETAQNISETLLHERLIACSNILPNMLSMYRWNDALERSEEVVLLLKTQASLQETLMQRLSSLHPYEVPCIFALQPSAVLTSYAQWITDNVQIP